MMHFLLLAAVSTALHLGNHQSVHFGHHKTARHAHIAHHAHAARRAQHLRAAGALAAPAAQQGAHHGDECEHYETPCDCTVEGCGWSTIRGECEAGAQTDCLECPNILLCGDETCMMQMLDDDDVVEAQRKGKECVEDGNDMADCLCDDDIGGLMESKLQAAGCCEANELFWEMCYNRKCDAEPGSCANVVEPCECGVQPGCGWDSDKQACVEGGKTECEECPHTLLCHGGDKHDVCSSALFKNPDVLEAINQAKVCMQSERDGMEYCLRHASTSLKALIEAVEWDGDTINCCEDNKFFSMVCEGPKTTTTAAPAPADEPAEPAEAVVDQAKEPEEEAGDEEPATTTTSTTTLDLMAEIERLAREYGLVTTTPAPDGSGDGGDGGDGSGDGDGGGDGSGDGSDDGSAGGAGADGAGSGGADGGVGGAGDAAAGSTGGETSGSLDQSAKNTADQVNALNDANAPEEDPVLARKTPPEDQE